MELYNKKNVQNEFSKFATKLKSKGAKYDGTPPIFAFLCGANQSKGIVSERRKALIDFSKAHLPNTHFFLAEKTFEVLIEEGHKKNILDVESSISLFSDFIIIVLESNSAFAELGAFAKEDKLRDKLIVINDSRFKHEQSFINLGPIKAVVEQAGDEAILLYRMTAKSVAEIDRISDTFRGLENLIKSHKKGLRNPKFADLDPSGEISKNNVMFVHDVINILGKVTHKELIEVHKLIFGDSKSYDNIKLILGLLSAFGVIERNNTDGFYYSLKRSNYLVYAMSLSKIIGITRNHILRMAPSRYAYD